MRVLEVEVEAWFVNWYDAMKYIDSKKTDTHPDATKHMPTYAYGRSRKEDLWFVGRVTEEDER
jgi:hypothetical protein